jgi:hypothetical protein
MVMQSFRTHQVSKDAKMFAVMGALLLVPIDAVAATTVQRPLSEFISAQGKHADFFPPVPDYIGWVSQKNSRVPTAHFALIDYAGLANEQFNLGLGTRVTGNVIERSLSDGRAQVSVTFKTTNALSWAIPCVLPDNCPLQTGPVIFGNRAADVAQGEPAALGNVEFRITFINTAPGAALPDLIDVFFSGDYEIKNYSFQSHANGEYCNGTVGGMTVSQAGNIPVRSNVQPAIINFGPPLPKTCPSPARPK